MLRAIGLTKLHGTRVALQNLSLNLEAGQFVALPGPNGAGRSTLCQVLTGLFAADEGEVELAGHPLRRSATAALLHRPSVLLLDEATVGPDPKSRQHLLRALHADVQERSERVSWAAHRVEQAVGEPSRRGRRFATRRAPAAGRLAWPNRASEWGNNSPQIRCRTSTHAALQMQFDSLTARRSSDLRAALLSRYPRARLQRSKPTTELPATPARARAPAARGWLGWPRSGRAADGRRGGHGPGNAPRLRLRRRSRAAPAPSLRWPGAA